MKITRLLEELYPYGGQEFEAKLYGDGTRASCQELQDYGFYQGDVVLEDDATQEKLRQLGAKPGDTIVLKAWYIDNTTHEYTLDVVNVIKNNNSQLDDFGEKIAESIDFNGASHRGAVIPSAKDGCINQCNIPDGMRPKYFDTDYKDNKLTVVWLTQEDFDDYDFEVFTNEVSNAVSYWVIKLNCPFNIKVSVIASCRDGEKYGYGADEFEITGCKEETKSAQQHRKFDITKFKRKK